MNSKKVPPPSNESSGERATVKASSASSTWRSVCGWLALYLSTATECARSSRESDTTCGNSFASVGKSFDSSA
eukprot:3431825-Prymnesium_polylepis.1